MKKLIFFKQNTVLNGYHIESGLDVLQSSYYKSPLGYNNVDWFVDEVIILEKIALHFKNTRKTLFWQKKMKKIIKKNNICRFYERYFECDKVRDLCHLTGNYKGPAHSICIINVTQLQCNFIPFLFHNFSSYDCPMFFKKLVGKKNDKVKFDIIPKTNEEHISVTCGCIRFIDKYRLLSSSLDSSVKTLADNSHKTLKDFEEKIVDNDEILHIVNEIKIIITEGKYKIDSIRNLKKDYRDRVENLEKVSLNYLGEDDLKLLKTEFPDKWK